MENCTTYAEQICEKLKQEIQTYKKDEELIEEGESKNNLTSESKKNEIRMILRYLANNFENDLFAEEFISNNGIQYLDTIIQYNTGNIRNYALQGLSKLLYFQIAYDYF